MQDLETALLDLHRAIHHGDIPLIIGGGFGIYLRSRHTRALGVATLLGEYPEVRSTNDIDLFLRPELLIQPRRLRPLAEALQSQGYEAVPEGAKYQFERPGPGGLTAGGIRIDILTGPQSRFDGTSVKTDERRARPTPSVGIHAHPVNEVPTLEEHLQSVVWAGACSDGAPWRAHVFLPNVHSYLMMKVFAFSDQQDEEAKELGRHHALDMYTLLAYTTEQEWTQALDLRDRYADHALVGQAGELVGRYFSDSTDTGILRLKESAYYRPALQVSDFSSALRELFPVRT